MLTLTKKITLTGQSEFEIGEQTKIAVAMTAVIGEDGSFSKSENVIDPSLYELNKEDAKKDMKEFSDIVYRMSSEATAE